MCQIFDVKPTRSPTRFNLTQTVRRIDMQETDPLPENFVIDPRLTTCLKLKGNKNQNFHS